MKIEVHADSHHQVDGAAPSSLKTKLLLLALLLVVAVVYWPGLGGGFTFDDYPNIVFNQPLHVERLAWPDWVAAVLSSRSSDMQRPLAMFTFAINHFFTGLNPAPMKLTNLAIHLINVILVFGLSRNLLAAAIPTTTSTSRQRVSLFISAAWALLPINFMAVLLIVQRMEILSHTFVLAGLWLYLRGRLAQREGRPGWKLILLGVLGCTAIGALSKESAVLLPLYAFCIELCIFHFKGEGGARQPRLPAFFVGALLLPAALGLAWILPSAIDPAAYAGRNFSLLERLLTEPRVVMDYLRWSLAPDLGQLSLFHDDYPVSRSLNSPGTLLGVIGITTLVALAFWTARRRPLISLGIAWFLSAQLLTATFIPLELVFEHRNYFGSLGVLLALADILLIAPIQASPRRLGTLLALLMLGFHGVTTHLRAIEWSNPLRFAQTEAKKHPQSPRATYQLGQTYAALSKGNPDSPFTQAAFDAFERARQVPRANILPAQGALLLAARTGRPFEEAWWRDINTRLREQPIGPQELAALGSLTDCAIMSRCRFQTANMLEVYASALSQGDHPEALNIYANYALNVLRDPTLAERLWREASRLRPKEPQYVISLTKLMIALGREEDARQEIRRLRAMGKLHQFETIADSLDTRLAHAMQSQEIGR